ncbi:MAG: TRAP transporter substrate-binding protein, partial [Acetobacteraceae bacterium]|nr:TRAP transporter substrate-binding protein [Acetobacteraceae bacterium]
MTRRNLIGLTGSVLAAPVTIRQARAAEVIWKFAHSAPTSFPLHIRLTEASQRIKEQSGGRMDLQIFPNGQLGGDNDLLSQVRSGAIQFAQPTGQILATILPVAAISALGFAWTNYDSVWPAVDGDLGKYIRGQIIAKTGLYPMERMWDLGFRQVTTNTKPITTGADLVGLKIRVPVAPSLVSLFKTLKAAPLALQFTELYSALQTHIADAQENPLALIAAAKLYEVQKYCSITNHSWDGHWMSCNAMAWKRLPDDLKDIVAKNLNQSALDERADLARLAVSTRTDLEGKGMAFNTADTKSFRDGLRDGGFYKYWREKLGEEPWHILEKYAGP